MIHKKYVISITIVALALLMVVTVQAGHLAQRSESSLRAAPQAGLSSAFTYQGQLKSAGDPVTADCEMAFRLYDDALAGSQVGSAVTQTVPVAEGLFAVNLDFGSEVFDGDARWLGVRVNCPGDSVSADLGRQALTAVPYALYAARSGGPEHVVTVAKSGGDYTSVQAAVDSIADAAPDNAYLVWIAPGVYSETVTLKPHVHLQGAGQAATIITGTVTNRMWPLAQATLVLTTSTSVRDLMVGNSAVVSYTVTVLAQGGVTQTLLSDVTVLAQGSDTDANYAVYLTGSGTGATLLDVTALAENSHGPNHALYNSQGASVIVRGGSYTARGGARAWGIHNYSYDKSSYLYAENIIALGEDSVDNSGVFNFGGVATLSGGTITARGEDLVRALQNYSDAEMRAFDVMVLAEANSGENCGVCNTQGAVMLLSGGATTARGGDNANGILNGGSASTQLVVEGVIAVGEAGNSNQGLRNVWSGSAVLRGSSFIGRGGSTARGIWNDSANTELDAENVVMLGEEGDYNYGLLNENSATATVRGGSCTGIGGNSAWGISTSDSSTYLSVERVTICGRDASTNNNGLVSISDAAVDVTQSVLEGSDTSVMTAGGGGPVTLTHSSLIGGMATGNVTCVAVSRGLIFSTSACP